MNGYEDERPPFMEGFIAWAGNLPAPVYAVLALIGAIGGFVYGVQQPEHHPQYLYAVFGGFFGLILIPVIALLIRFAIQCVIVCLLGLAVWYAFFKPVGSGDIDGNAGSIGSAADGVTVALRPL